MQGILARFRAWVRAWLGLSSDFWVIRKVLESHEVRARTRHEAVLGAVNRAALDYLEATKKSWSSTAVAYADILAKLQEINMRLTVAKVDHPSNYQSPVYDWDTVQAIAAHALETSEAPKEEELV